MRNLIRHSMLFIMSLALILIAVGCTNKNSDSSKGPSYQKNTVVTEEKSINDQVLQIHNKREIIYGHVYTSKEKVTKRPIAIVSHGLGGNYQELENYARNLAKKGYLAYAFDFPGGSSNGQSKGLSQTQMSIYTEEQDLLAIIKTLRRRGDVDKNNILLVGGSQGGVVSALTASQHPDYIKGLALMYPAFSITHDAQEKYSSVDKVPQETDIFGFSVGKTYYQKLLNIDITKVATKYKGPVLIVHGTDDDIVPIKYVQQAADNFSNVDFEKLSGAGHGFEGNDQQKALKFLDRFVDKIKNN